MREIKFRVWWVHPESDSMGFDYFKAGEQLEQSDPLQEYSQIEQFTGLRDKSGKEIYEGDIVRLSRAMKYSGNRGDVGAIEADPVELGYRVMNIYPRTRLTEPRSAYLEIIGNVHENPEMLEEVDS